MKGCLLFNRYTSVPLSLLLIRNVGKVFAGCTKGLQGLPTISWITMEEKYWQSIWRSMETVKLSCGVEKYRYVWLVEILAILECSLKSGEWLMCGRLL